MIDLNARWSMATMNVDKLDVHTYLATAASSAPPSLLSFFERFRTQYDRRCGHNSTRMQRGKSDGAVPAMKVMASIDSHSGGVL